MSAVTAQRENAPDMNRDPRQHHGFIPSSAEDLLRRRVKGELRKRMRGLRNALPVSAIAGKSARIVERLGSLDALAHAGAVALFWPIEARHEVDLRPLDAQLRARGVRVAYPALASPDAPMAFRFVAAIEAMRAHAFGQLEPAATDPEAARGELDVIVMPALALDPRGHRIGYGAGHYDRALPLFVPPATTIAVAFDFQLVAETPNTPGDVAATWVVTDVRALRAAEDAR